MMRTRTGLSRILLMLVAAIALLALAAACGDDDDKGSTLRVGMIADFNTLDPPSLLGMPDIVTVQHTYDVLVTKLPDLSLQPMLAESWEPNADASQWTFHLREGVKFADGEEFTAEDVIFTINRLFEMESPLASAMGKPTAMVAVDDHTLRFEFDGPNAVLLDALVKYHAHITPKNLDPERAKTETFGTGPFRMTEFIVGEMAVFERNEDYWWEGHPKVDRMEYIFLTSPEARAEALKAGDIDVIYDLDMPSVPGLEADPNVKVLTAASGGYMDLAMDVREAPFDNKLVRQALQAATDRNAILQTAQFGMGGIAYDVPLLPSDPVYNPNCKPPDYDPELAKSLLAQAGYPNGIEVELHASTAGASMVEMATAFKEKAAAAGIEVSINVVPEENYWADTWLHVPFTTVWWGGRPPYEAFSVVYLSGGSWNESHYSNERVDELLGQAMAAGDLADQKRIYGELQCIIVDEVPRIIPVFRPVMLAMRNNVENLEPMFDATMHAHTATIAEE